MSFKIVQEDITEMNVDAIVNAANTQLRMGGGVCGAIFKAAGVEKLQAACSQLAPIKTGEAVITEGFNLPARYIIHTAGPIYSEWSHEQSEFFLRSSYLNSLQLALDNHCESIAFPLISSGIYGYPKEEALRVATSAIRDFLLENEMDVYLAIFDKSSFSVDSQLLDDVDNYLDENLVDEVLESEILRESIQVEVTSLDQILVDLDEPFPQLLFKLIDNKKMTDVEVYKKANLDRKLFSKIRTQKNYKPSKKTVIALAIALELSLEETEEILERAGYALSHADKFDVIIEYFLLNGQYDIFKINQVLFEYDQPLLG